MQKVDEAGIFAVLIPGKKIPAYYYIFTDADGESKQLYDPYAYEPFIDAVDIKKFESGIHYNVYEKLGSHVMEVDGVSGVLFAVWAPNALAVSVVCNSNGWNGKVHLMRRLGASGIFELFVPGMDEGEVYKYEIRIKGGSVLKADPYGNLFELRPATATVVYDLSRQRWTDEKWMEERDKKNYDRSPMSIYEVHLASWKKPGLDDDEGIGRHACGLHEGDGVHARRINAGYGASAGYVLGLSSNGLLCGDFPLRHAR